MFYPLYYIQVAKNVVANLVGQGVKVCGLNTSDKVPMYEMPLTYVSQDQTEATNFLLMFMEVETTGISGNPSSSMLKLKLKLSSLPR